MRCILILSVFLIANPVRAADAETLRARAALALAFAPARPTYVASYQQAVAEAKPLVVFVGQPAAEVAGCVSIAVDAFPEAAAPAVVVGLPGANGLRRIDLPGTPSRESIHTAVGGRPPGRSLLPSTRCDGTTNCREK